MFLHSQLLQPLDQSGELCGKLRAKPCVGFCEFHFHLCEFHYYWQIRKINKTKSQENITEDPNIPERVLQGAQQHPSTETDRENPRTYVNTLADHEFPEIVKKKIPDHAKFEKTQKLRVILYLL